jgi:hypothetical protein
MSIKFFDGGEGGVEIFSALKQVKLRKLGDISKLQFY